MFDLQLISQSIIRIGPKQRFALTIALLLVITFLAPIIPAHAAKRAVPESHGADSVQPVEQRVSCGASAYRVRPGDTLGSIARRFNTSSSAIRRCNRLSSSIVYVGQVLSIPGVASRSVSTPKARVTRYYNTPSPGGPGSGDTYNPYFREPRATPVPRR